jgi:DNA-binding transcriptional LysR family regulator
MIYNDLALFTAVARNLSFSAAAQQFDIPLSRVSRRIAELEDHLGVKLFERTTRKVRLTEEGRRLLDRCQDPIEALLDLSGVTEDTHRRTIRVTAAPLALRVDIGPLLLDFAQSRPDITFDLTPTNANLDFFRDNIDLAFRLGPLGDSSLVARKLWTLTYDFCAAPKLLEKHGLGPDLALAQFLDLPALVTRQPWIVNRNESLDPTNIAHELDDLELVQKAATLGLGTALLPREMIKGDLLPLRVKGATPIDRDMFVVYPGKRLLPSHTRDLIDFMASRNRAGTP